MSPYVPDPDEVEDDWGDETESEEVPMPEKEIHFLDISMIKPGRNEQIPRAEEIISYFKEITLSDLQDENNICIQADSLYNYYFLSNMPKEVK